MDIPNNKALNETNIKIKYNIDNKNKTVKLRLNNDDNLLDSFNSYTSNIRINKSNIGSEKKSFYLVRGKKRIILDKNEKIKNLDLKEGELILVSNSDINSDFVYGETRKNANPIDVINLRQKKYILLFVLFAIIALGLSFFLIYYFFFRSKKEENIHQNKIYQKEELITKKRPYYPTKMLFLYRSDKIMNLDLKTKIKIDNNKTKIPKIKEFMDFGLLIREEHQDFDEDKNMTKVWYTGYISLLNLTINNETHDFSLNYNEEIHQYINKISYKHKNNLRILNKVNKHIILTDIKEKCFAKINFYENGEIKDIFIPKEFDIENILYINRIANYIIPKLSKNLYSQNISEKIEDIIKSNNKISEDEEEDEIINEGLMDDDIEDENEQENLEENTERSDIDKMEYETNKNNGNSLRRNSESSDNTDDIVYDNVNENEIENSKSLNEDSAIYSLKGINENNTFSNITDFEMQSLQGEKAELEGSQLKRIKNSYIDERGMVVFITEYENITIYQPEKESLSDLTKEEDKIKSEIYNDNNEIQRNDNEDFMGKNISFDFSSIISENFNNISLYDRIDNEEFVRNIFQFFDKFTYIKYNQTDATESKRRLLKNMKDDFIKLNKDINPSQVEFEHSHLSNNKSKKRNLQTDNSGYYGKKNFDNEKILYKYNLMGLVLEGIVVSKNSVSTGVSENYIKVTFGFVNMKYSFNKMQTNLHIIIKNTNQMTYNFMGLLYFSNEELKKRNKIYSDIIIDLEKNVSKLLEQYYDYTDLFRDSLESLYNQVKNFSGEFFNELIELIERVYDNYTIILNQTENNKYDILNQIRNAIKYEYINYINDMFDKIISFKNDTLLFLLNIKNEVDIIQTFQLDILYDIIDIIYDGMSVFKEFIKKLFKAVERGIMNFKYDLRDYMEEKIGDLLYLTDFLSINLNKNEILTKAINSEKRQNITIKLKNFRNIILRIIEILDNNIFNDYEEEMSLDNANSIKYDKENIIKKYIEDIDEKTYKVIEEIKIKIQFMNYYENYANNIQIINEITNKSFIEFNNEMYNKVLSNINKITPEYMDNSSELIKNKNYLFSLSNDLVNNINNEISTINSYIDLYYTDYIKENNYNIDYNIYNFRKYFTNEYLLSLINDFKSIIKEALQVHYINIINYNYNLSYEYIEEVYNYLNRSPHYRILANVFIDYYSKYKAAFQEMAYYPSSDEFMKFIEDNFFNASRYVLNHVDEKLKTINKYYFNETNRYNFYKLELIQNEINELTKNINNYFNEITLDTDINQFILNISLKEIPTLNKEREKKLDDLYNKTYNLTEDVRLYQASCEVIQLIKRKKRKWYTLFITYKIKYYFYCIKTAKTKNNINKIIKDLSITKNYLNQKFNNLVDSYINKFDIYLNNLINISQTLYDNLLNYTEEKIENNEKIILTLNNYQEKFNNTLINNSEEKIIERIVLKNGINISEISNVISKLGINLFEINNTYYQYYYLKDNQFFLEYPDEILFKLNQSTNYLKSNNEVIKSEINLSFNNKIENIIFFTNLFIDNINKFNLEYILNKIDKEYIFDKYITQKFDLINNFFNSIQNEIYRIEQNSFLNESLLNEDNYDYFINSIENEYSSFSTYLYNKINENFTILNCVGYINDESEDDVVANNNSVIKNCTKERYSTNLNYSKYNFNIVKFRTEISNSRKYPEIFNQIFDDLNYNKIIDFNEIIEIDNTINSKNILNIYNATKDKLKLIKEEFFSMINQTFYDFGYDFINNNEELASYSEVLQLFKEIFNYENIIYNNNINETNDFILDNIDKLLDDFNSSLSIIANQIIGIIDNYEYYSTNLIQIYNNYFNIIKTAFDNYTSKINSLKTNNLFYIIPKTLLNETFFERKKYINLMINQFSSKYNFDSLGFKYEIDKEFDLYLKNYYISNELNKTYSYFEFMDYYSKIYIDKLVTDIENIRNKTENKFNSIFEYFFASIKKGNNYKEIEYIENIIRNHSLCLHMLPNLYSNISYHLNQTNVTESVDFLSNNCTIEGIINALYNNLNNDSCLIISDLNNSLYLDDIDKLLDCRNNNYYNFSYMIFDKLELENMNNLDKIIYRIIQIINENIIDENFLNNYIQKNYKMNTSLEINMNDFHNYFEDIEDLNLYINNIREPEYKNLMYNIFIEAFNKSYVNILKSYITNEIIDTINILVNDKLDIFINSYSNKIRYDFDYFKFLLKQIKELGNSSKLSIINLFSKIPKKLNETIYYTIEEEIFYYIDIFFRENKNIFIDNFLKFYLNDEKNFNIDIYKVKDYIIEMISDRKFNLTLNNISSYLITEIKNEVKANVKNKILNKINSFIEECNIISNDIQNILNQIITSELPEEMENLIQLINNYTILVENQNNRYNFSIGEEPFNILNRFIDEELEPPLLLIYDKYNSIEEKLLNSIKILVKDFPDCYSEVKKNLLGDKIESINYFTEQINSTLFDYQNILDNEIKSYINKLIHFTYIDGLLTMNTSCENSDCGIPMDSLRRLNKKDNIQIMKVYEGHHLLENKTEIKEKINKKINFNNKRRTSSVSSLPEFTPDMGELTVDDVIYYLSDVQNTILKFNKSYFGREYINVNLTLNKYLSKINFTYLEKLRFSFDIKLVKFSTILTQNSLNKLEDIILMQYYLIKEFVHKSADLVQSKINYFLNELNNTSKFIESLSGYTHNQALGYYEILHHVIQGKYETIDNKRLRALHIIEESDYSKRTNYTKRTVLEIVSFLNFEITIDFNITHILTQIFNFPALNDIIEKINKLKIGKNLEIQLYIPFPLFPYLQIRLYFKAYAGLGFYTSIEPDWRHLEFSLVLDVYAEAKCSLAIEGGLYIPETSGPKVPVQIALVVGLEGIIAHGRAGVKYELSLNDGKVTLDAYFIFNALVFEFYIQFRIKIQIPLFKLEFKFDIIRIELYGFHVEAHTIKKKQEEAFKKRFQWGVDSPIGIGVGAEPDEE